MEIYRMRRTWMVFAMGGLLAVGFAGAFLAQTDSTVQAQGKGDASVEKARKHVKMLDELYKNAVVSITKRYVQKQDDQPAAMVAKDVFAAMEKSGHHKARLVDASGQPQNKANVAQSEFEKLAVEAMKKGDSYFDRVITKDGKRTLQAATIVPAVMKQCADCHGVKENQLLGTLVYEVTVE